MRRAPRPARGAAARGGVARRQALCALVAGALWPAAAVRAATPGSDAALALADGESLWVVEPRGVRLRHRLRLPGAPAVTALAAAGGGRVVAGGADGTLHLVDLCRGEVYASVQALQRVGALAVARDVGHLLAADAEAPQLVLLDAALHVLHRYDVTDLARTRRSPVAALGVHAARRSFVVAPRDLPELWEISLDPRAEPIYDGLVHDFRMGEAVAREGYLGVRRTPLAAPLAELRIDPQRPHVLAYAAAGGGRLLTLNLDIRRALADLALADTPAPAGAAAVMHDGEPAWLVPHRDAPRLSLVGARRGELRAQRPAPAAAGRLWAPAASPWLWFVAGSGTSTTLHLLDARRFEPVAVHVLDGEATGALHADADHAALLLRQPAPALVVWQLASGRELGRLALGDASATVRCD